jgi:hypothetical protein
MTYRSSLGGLIPKIKIGRGNHSTQALTTLASPGLDLKVLPVVPDQAPSPDLRFGLF